MKGVRFGNKHTYQEWGIILVHTDISFPSAKRELVDIPGSDGVLDFSKSLVNDIKYENRAINFEFITTKPYELWKNLISDIANYLHEQTFKIILDEDPNYYYKGNAKINQFASDKSLGKIVIECDVEPYKYDLTSSNEDWLWDPFDFESGIINETKNIEVKGTRKITIIGRRKKVVPVITCSNSMQVVFNYQTYNLLAGKQKRLEIQICEGINELTFIGNGIVDIEYRGGSL